MWSVRVRVAVGVGLVGAALTLMVAWRVAHTPPLYVSEVRYNIATPASQGGANPLTSGKRSAIGMAEVIAASLGESSSQFASPDATIVSAGVHEGVSVRLPDTGGQWSVVFEDPWLEILAVSPSEVRSAAMATDEVKRVDRAVEDLQDARGVAAENRVRTWTDPAGPVVTRPVGGRPSRAAAVALALGLALTAWLVRVVAGGGVGRGRDTEEKTTRPRHEREEVVA